jgi:hypothetical protein
MFRIFEKFVGPFLQSMVRGERWEVKGERWKVKDERWEVKSEKWKFKSEKNDSWFKNWMTKG